MNTAHQFLLRQNLKPLLPWLPWEIISRCFINRKQYKVQRIKRKILKTVEWSIKNKKIKDIGSVNNTNHMIPRKYLQKELTGMLLTSERKKLVSYRINKYYSTLLWSRDIVVGIATSFGLDDRGFGVRVPSLFSTSSRSILGAHPASYAMSTGGSLPMGKATGARS
jgi:hypothetical protein